MAAIGERDAAVAETENRAGGALRELTEREGLSLSEALEWCDETVTVRDATRRDAAAAARYLAAARRAVSARASRAATARRRWQPLEVAERGPVRHLDDAGPAAAAAAIPDPAALTR